jgi:hypothetical protein
LRSRYGKIGPHETDRARLGNEDTRAPELPSVRMRRQDRSTEQIFKESRNKGHARNNIAQHKGYDSGHDNSEPKLETARVIKLKSEILAPPDVNSGPSGHPHHALDDQIRRLSIVENDPDRWTKAEDEKHKGMIIQMIGAFPDRSSNAVFHHMRELVFGESNGPEIVAEKDKTLLQRLERPDAA